MSAANTASWAAWGILSIAFEMKNGKILVASLSEALTKMCRGAGLRWVFGYECSIAGFDVSSPPATRATPEMDHHNYREDPLDLFLVFCNNH